MSLTLEHIVSHGHGRVALLRRHVEASSACTLWHNAALTGAVRRRGRGCIVQVDRWQISGAIANRGFVPLALRIVAAVVFIVKGRAAADVHLAGGRLMLSGTMTVARRSAVTLRKGRLRRRTIGLCLMLAGPLGRSVVFERLQRRVIGDDTCMGVVLGVSRRRVLMAVVVQIRGGRSNGNRSRGRCLAGNWVRGQRASLDGRLLPQRALLNVGRRMLF